ncbi:hypothetical protein M408DRAFT_328034 [Serendipita vermifera MAFF 305830]|uniref:Ketoreductase domain-containing protein n=1 Tax=Serendipita vermifera MAFF 305830 TaxID=933852 RepID=A0A0C3BG24_SERVB|nr:hypothetical protein M408DRAFT_328034 [Serendipita vermifera MAFF 305830]
MSLEGKIAIVTGAARGIGAAVAVALGKQGASVVLNYVSPSSKARTEELAASIGKAKTLVVQADVGKLEDIDRLVKETVDRFGKIDILMNNGGVLDDQNIGQITDEVYQKTFNVNVRAVIFLSQAVVPYMGDGGRIINVSSISARLAFPGDTVYSASKVAVEAITRVMGMELRPKGIRVTAINPGPVSTSMFLDLPKEKREAIAAAFPVAAPEDIADVVTFLASPQSRWVNAVVVGTNNGAVLN